VDVRNQ